MYICPANQVMKFWKDKWKNHSDRLYRTGAGCVRNKLWRIIYRSEYRDVVDRLRTRLKSEKGREKLNRRKEIAEHLFGTMKRPSNQSHLLLKD